MTPNPAVADAGCLHIPIVIGALKPRDLPQFKWVNTVLGNLKTTLAGAFHSLEYSKYTEHYLAAFSYRFNRRFDLRGLIARLIVDVARRKPSKEELVRALAEARFQSGLDVKRQVLCPTNASVGINICWYCLIRRC